VIFTGVMRCELSKAPWRNLGLLRRLAERREDLSAAFLWLSAPKPRPTRDLVERWADGYRWPLEHRPAPAGDLRPDEVALWRSADELNQAFAGRCAMLYVNQFGWSKEVLGALDPGASTFADLRSATDVEVGLSIYEPFGIAPLEPYSAGAVCVLSDACGCAQYLTTLGLDQTVVIGRFTSHSVPPEEVTAEVLRGLEQRVYDQVLDEVLRRLGFAGGGRDVPRARIQDFAAHWREHREPRARAAQEAAARLSWAAALQDHLLPAIE
jgi:hypothetical protein